MPHSWHLQLVMESVGLLSNPELKCVYSAPPVLHLHWSVEAARFVSICMFGPEDPSLTSHTRITLFSLVRRSHRLAWKLWMRWAGVPAEPLTSWRTRATEFTEDNADLRSPVRRPVPAGRHRRPCRQSGTHRLPPSPTPTGRAGRPTSCTTCRTSWSNPCGGTSSLGLSTSRLMPSLLGSRWVVAKRSQVFFELVKDAFNPHFSV